MDLWAVAERAGQRGPPDLRADLRLEWAVWGHPGGRRLAYSVWRTQLEHHE
jgi:hypothetical protein